MIARYRIEVYLFEAMDMIFQDIKVVYDNDVKAVLNIIEIQGEKKPCFFLVKKASFFVFINSILVFIYFLSRTEFGLNPIVSWYKYPRC